MSRIRIEDHYNLLHCAKETCDQVDVRANSTLHQHKHQLKRVSTETLRDIAYELLAALGIDSR